MLNHKYVQNIPIYLKKVIFLLYSVFDNQKSNIEALIWKYKNPKHHFLKDDTFLLGLYYLTRLCLAQCHEIKMCNFSATSLSRRGNIIGRVDILKSSLNKISSFIIRFLLYKLQSKKCPTFSCHQIYPYFSFFMCLSFSFFLSHKHTQSPV